MIVLSFSLFYDNNDNNTSSSDNTVQLCSMTTDNNQEDFNDTYSDYICLTSPIVKIDKSTYRCVGSLFLGYEDDICYLYYPVAYINNNIRSYEYTRIVCITGKIYDISIAVQNTQISTVAINVNFRFFIYREPTSNVPSLKRNIYDINYFDYKCYVDDITPYDSSLIGYSTFNDYFCYSSNNDYRFLMRLFKVGNLLDEPNTYSITDRYNPCLHFNDFSGYTIGYDLGYNAGYSYGYDSGAVGESVFDTITKGANSLLNIEIFPNFDIGECFLIMMVVILFGVLMKVFRF